MKKIISLLLTICILLSCTSSLSVIANAATTKINNFSESTKLNAEEYGALREGKISVIKKSDGFYYKFLRNRQTVLVKTSAFTSTCANDYTDVNNALTKGVMRTDGMYTEKTFTYKTRTVSKTRQTAALKNYTVTNYKTYIAWLVISSNRPGNKNEIDLECYKKSQVQFSYSNKILDRGDPRISQDDKYKTPTTEKEYAQALSRTTSYDLSTNITPKFMMSIKNPGSTIVCLNNYKFEGRGIKNNIDTKNDISTYVEVAQVAANVVKSFVAAKKTGSISLGAFKGLLSLGIKTGKMLKDKQKSDIYTTNEFIKLSKDKDNKTNYVMAASFKSPIKLQNYNDFFRTEIKLNLKPNSKTKITVNFAIV